MSDSVSNAVRIDKWLWAARFFKTRSAAAQAVTGGRVHLNGARTKPAKPVQVGDELRIHCNEVEFMVKVLGLGVRRGPDVAARLLYEEDAESIRARERLREQRRLEAAGPTGPKRRPSKRDRRLIHSFIRQEKAEG